jgi:hypothetical protein
MCGMSNDYHLCSQLVPTPLNLFKHGYWLFSFLTRGPRWKLITLVSNISTKCTSSPVCKSSGEGGEGLSLVGTCLSHDIFAEQSSQLTSAMDMKNKGQLGEAPTYQLRRRTFRLTCGGTVVPPGILLRAVRVSGAHCVCCPTAQLPRLQIDPCTFNSLETFSSFP